MTGVQVGQGLAKLTPTPTPIYPTHNLCGSQNLWQSLLVPSSRGTRQHTHPIHRSCEMIFYLSFTFEHAQIQQDPGFDWSFGKKLGCSNTTPGFSAIHPVMISSPGNVWPRANLTILENSLRMSCHWGRLQCYHPSIQTKAYDARLTSGWVAGCLAIIFNISNGYTNSSNKISTTYTAQKQILLSPKKYKNVTR